MKVSLDKHLDSTICKFVSVSLLKSPENVTIDQDPNGLVMLNLKACHKINLSRGEKLAFAHFPSTSLKVRGQHRRHRASQTVFYSGWSDRRHIQGWFGNHGKSTRPCERRCQGSPADTQPHKLVTALIPFGCAGPSSCGQEWST